MSPVPAPGTPDRTVIYLTLGCDEKGTLLLSRSFSEPYKSSLMQRRAPDKSLLRDSPNKMPDQPFSKEVIKGGGRSLQGGSSPSLLLSHCNVNCCALPHSLCHDGPEPLKLRADTNPFSRCLSQTSATVMETHFKRTLTSVSHHRLLH